jgi:hypothetical protein
MTDYREINALAKDPDRARSLAEILSGMNDIGWTDWEVDFLEHMGRRTEELSTRQGEKLVELRDASIWYEKVDGFSVRLLINDCFQHQHLLSVSGQAFIRSLKEQGVTRLRRRQAAWLMRCARRVRAIEGYQGRSLDPPRRDEE